jgi:transcriptional regulator with XRE-family HTH domain
MRLRQLLGKEAGAAVDVFELRKKLGLTQRVFGTQFSVSRQQVQKWESGKATPHRGQLDKLVKLAEAAAAVGPPLAISPDMLTISGAAAYSGITEKTIRKAVKDGRLMYTVDTSPGPWPKQGRYLIRRSDLEAFKMNSYDPYFKKGRWVPESHRHKSRPSSILAFAGRAFEAPATRREET